MIRTFRIAAASAAVLALSNSAFAQHLGQPGSPTSAEPPGTPSSPERATESTAAFSSEERQKQEEWQDAMSRIPLPTETSGRRRHVTRSTKKGGCFKGSYPSREWQEVPCTTTPTYPQLPRHGSGASFVGGDLKDVSVKVPKGYISVAKGSFDRVDVKWEKGRIANQGVEVDNAYTLQLNTNFFKSKVCADSPNKDCRAWEQFIFQNTVVNGHPIGRAYFQYWIIAYNTTCPKNAGWTEFRFTGEKGIYCYKNNSGGAVKLDAQPITNLGRLSLEGAVSVGGDRIGFSDGRYLYARRGDNAVDAAHGWQIAEFNVFGDGGNTKGGSQARFNSDGAVVVPRTKVTYAGSVAAPSCWAGGFTAETNNLRFGHAPPASQPGPALIFTEALPGTGPSGCEAATAIVGAPH
jgi:hypothetical protein